MNKKTFLSGCWALITGGAKRIGSNIGIALARAGANIIVHYNRSKKEAEELCKRLTGKGKKAIAIQADLHDSSSVSDLWEKSLKVSNGKIDILINNAATFIPNTISNVSPSDIIRDIQINAIAPFMLMRFMCEQMKGGSIINFLDCRIRDHNRYYISYHISKKVLEIITSMFALEFSSRFKINAIAPWLVFPPEGKDEKFMKKIAMRSLIPRPAKIEDIVDTVIFLLKNQYITGQIIYVDGGYHLKVSNRLQ